MDIILIAGLWLPASIWDDVVDELRAHGHRPHPLQLPGVDDGSTTANLGDQLSAALDAVDEADRPLVVGHSAAVTLAWLVADRRPADITGVAWIGGFAATSGSSYAAFFPSVDGVMAFPGWDPFDGPDSADLDDQTRARLASIAVPVPESVSTAQVMLSDERRFAVPVTVVCPEFNTDQARGWVDDGQIPELARAEHASFVNIESGHWPMVTQAAELARILDEATRTSP